MNIQMDNLIKALQFGQIDWFQFFELVRAIEAKND